MSAPGNGPPPEQERAALRERAAATVNRPIATVGINIQERMDRLAQLRASVQSAVGSAAVQHLDGSRPSSAVSSPAMSPRHADLSQLPDLQVHRYALLGSSTPAAAPSEALAAAEEGDTGVRVAAAAAASLMSPASSLDVLLRTPAAEPPSVFASPRPQHSRAASVSSGDFEHEVQTSAQALRTQVSKLRARVMELEGNIRKKDQQIETLQKRLRASEESVQVVSLVNTRKTQEMEARIRELEERLRQQENSRELRERRIEDLMQTIGTLDGQLKEKITEIERLNLELARLQEKEQEFFKSQQSGDVKSQQYIMRLEQLQNIITDKTAEANELEKKLTAANARIRELSDAELAWKDEKARLVGEHALILRSKDEQLRLQETELIQLRERLERVQKEAKAQEDLARSTKHSFDDVQTQLRQVQLELADARHEVKRRDEQLAALRASFAEHKENANTNLAAAQAQVEELRLQLAEVSRKLEASEQKRVELERQAVLKQQAEVRVAELQDQLTQLRDRTSSLEHQVRSLESEKASFQDRLQAAMKHEEEARRLELQLTQAQAALAAKE